jgi:hypothetical protein
MFQLPLEERLLLARQHRARETRAAADHRLAANGGPAGIYRAGRSLLERLRRRGAAVPDLRPAKSG